MALQDQDVAQQVARRTMPTFFGDTAAVGSNPAGFWDNLLPQPYDGQDADPFPAWGTGTPAPQTLFGTPGYGYQPISEQAYTTNTETC